MDAIREEDGLDKSKHGVGGRREGGRKTPRVHMSQETDLGKLSSAESQGTVHVGISLTSRGAEDVFSCRREIRFIQWRGSLSAGG